MSFTLSIVYRNLTLPCKSPENCTRNFFKIFSSYLKILSATFLLVCFLSLKESTREFKKNVFYSLQTLYSFSENSKFRILDI